MVATMALMPTVASNWRLRCRQPLLYREPINSWGFSKKLSFSRTLISSPLLSGRNLKHFVSPNVSSQSLTIELLDAWDDEYNGVVVDANSLPSSANAFASALQASLCNWKLKGKKGIWLKILEDQADLVPIAIQEGFGYHHAEPGYVMLTCWIPDEPCMLPTSPSHQIGVGGFVINDKRESEDIFSGVVREVKEETGIDTIFLKMVAFRHVHQVALEKSDLLFVCMLKPFSFDITIDDKEIQAAKWMALDEFIGQKINEDDPMSGRVMDVCVAAYQDHYNGFIAHQLLSKFDGKMCYLYYDSTNNV